MALPPAVDQPCRECPWRREAAPGWLGPYPAREWLALAHSEEPVACHLTIDTDAVSGCESWDWPGVKQCRGLASYRANVSKLPRDPAIVVGPRDPEHVFRTWDEFLAHHGSKP